MTLGYYEARCCRVCRSVDVKHEEVDPTEVLSAEEIAVLGGSPFYHDKCNYCGAENKTAILNVRTGEMRYA